MKKLLFFLSLLVSLATFGQVYNPSLHTVSNKPYGMAQAGPTDARSMFYDEDNFVFRAYVDTAEVKAYLPLAKYRTGGFDILVNTGGTLGLNGVITGGTNAIWYFKDGTADANLVIKGGGITGIAWGDITGTLSLQTDLNAALVALVPLTRTITINGVAQTLASDRTWTIPTIQSVDGNNGITLLTDSIVQFGATNNSGVPLTASRWLNTGTNIFTVRGSSASYPLQVQTTHATGYAARFESVGGPTLQLSKLPSNVNSYSSVIDVIRGGTGAASAGVGGTIDYYNWIDNTNGSTYSGSLGIKLTNTTYATRRSQFDVLLTDNGATATMLSVQGNGQLIAPIYGDGVFTGLVTKWAAFTGTGELVEVDPPTGGSTSASDLTSGTLADARLSTNVPLKNAANTFSATNTFATISATSLSVGTVSNTEFSYLDGVSSAIQTQLDLKSPLASPTFTGTVVLPSTTSIGTVSSTEVGYVDGVTSAIQTQLDAKTDETNTITIQGAGAAQDLSASRTFYPKSYFQQTIEALGSVVKGQSAGVNMDQMSTTSFTAISGTVYWTAVWLPSPETLTGIKYWLGASGVFTGDSFNGFALYTYSGGTLTQVATSANDETIWKGTGNAYQTIPFTGSYVASAGLYFVAFLFHSSATTTSPTFGIGASVATGGMQSGDFPNSAKLSATQTSQTTLASTKAMSAITVTTLRPWIGLY